MNTYTWIYHFFTRKINLFFYSLQIFFFAKLVGVRYILILYFRYTIIEIYKTLSLGIISKTTAKKTGSVTKKDMQTPPQKCPFLHKRCGMCWIEWKIIFQIFPIFSFWIIGRQTTTHSTTKNIFLFKSGQICREDWHEWFFRMNDFFVRFLVFKI